MLLQAGWRLCGKGRRLEELMFQETLTSFFDPFYKTIYICWVKFRKYHRNDNTDNCDPRVETIVVNTVGCIFQNKILSVQLCAFYLFLLVFCSINSNIAYHWIEQSTYVTHWDFFPQILFKEHFNIFIAKSFYTALNISLG